MKHYLAIKKEQIIDKCNTLGFVWEVRKNSTSCMIPFIWNSKEGTTN